MTWVTVSLRHEVPLAISLFKPYADFDCAVYFTFVEQVAPCDWLGACSRNFNVLCQVDLDDS